MSPERDTRTVERDSAVAALAAALERVQVVKSERQREAMLAQLLDAAANATLVVDFLNQHAGNLLGADDAFRRDFMAADVIFRDGIGSRLALNLRRRRAGLNLNGTDLIPRIIAAFVDRHASTPRAAGSVMIYFGTRLPWLRVGATQLAGRYHGPILVLDGFRDDAAYLAALEPYRTHFKLIVLGMGMPRQEALARVLKQADIGPALILCGGAIIDFAAGRFARAPRWMRATGLEWLYRLANEPRRLFRRYVIGIPIFLRSALRAAVYRH